MGGLQHAAELGAPCEAPANGRFSAAAGRYSATTSATAGATASATARPTASATPRATASATAGAPAGATAGAAASAAPSTTTSATASATAVSGAQLPTGGKRTRSIHNSSASAGAVRKHPAASAILPVPFIIHGRPRFSRPTVSAHPAAHTATLYL